MIRRVLFRLSMPGVGSWNRKWSGASRNYALVKSASPQVVEHLGPPNNWRYDFGDGWVAQVSCRVMEKGERAPKSDGFCGYEWMVRNILQWGTPYCQHEWSPIEGHHTYGPGDWHRCKWCRSARRIKESHA